MVNHSLESVKCSVAIEKEFMKNDRLRSSVFHFMDKKEKTILHRNLRFANSDAACIDHVDLLQLSSRLLLKIVDTYQHRNADELALLGIGIRLLNDILSAFRLMFVGYYRISLSIQRDILETGFLLDYFTTSKKLITQWRTCSGKKRLKQFQPKLVRKQLDKRDGFTTGKRSKDYQLFCEYASHPTHGSSKLITKGKLAEIGPFYDEVKLKNTLYELTRLTDHAVAQFIRHFAALPNEQEMLKVKYIAESYTWMSKYLHSV